MSKQKLFLDFDNTIVDTMYAFCEQYNDIYKYNSNFKRANPKKVKHWNFKTQCPLQLGETEDLFSRKKLWEYMRLYSNAESSLKELSKKYDITIISIGTAENVAHKSIWIKQNLPMIKDVILIRNEGVKMDKSSINMEGATFVDDVKSNLDSSNASRKILFGKKYEWNKDWTGEWAKDWLDLYLRLK